MPETITNNPGSSFLSDLFRKLGYNPPQEHYSPEQLTNAWHPEQRTEENLRPGNPLQDLAYTVMSKLGIKDSSPLEAVGRLAKSQVEGAISGDPDKMLAMAAPAAPEGAINEALETLWPKLQKWSKLASRTHSGVEIDPEDLSSAAATELLEGARSGKIALSTLAQPDQSELVQFMQRIGGRMARSTEKERPLVPNTEDVSDEVAESTGSWAESAAARAAAPDVRLALKEAHTSAEQAPLLYLDELAGKTKYLHDSAGTPVPVPSMTAEQLAQLKPTQRQMVERLMDGLTPEQVGKELGFSEETVRTSYRNPYNLPQRVPLSELAPLAKETPVTDAPATVSLLPQFGKAPDQMAAELKDIRKYWNKNYTVKGKPTQFAQGFEASMNELPAKERDAIKMYFYRNRKPADTNLNLDDLYRTAMSLFQKARGE